MNLAKKKELAKRTLGVGKNRIIFNKEGIAEIKEAITKEDIKNLHKEGIIEIKPIKGRKRIEKRKRRRGPGKIKRRVTNRKQIYVKITRKLRAYIKELRNNNSIDKNTYKELRNKIKMRNFKSKSNLKEYLNSVKVSTKSDDKKERKIERKSKNAKKTKETKAKKENGGKGKPKK